MYKTIEKVLDMGENFVNGTLMIACIVVLFVNVFARYLFSAASTWAEEAIRYAIAWVTFLGCSQCAKTGTHVGIDIFIQLMPEKSHRYFNALAQFIGAAFTAVCTYAGWQMTELVITTGQRSPAILLPMWIVYFSIPLGFALTTIRFIAAGVRILLNKGSGSMLTDEEGNVDMSRM